MQLPPENIYGHTKKLRYILDAIARVAEDTPAPRVMDFGCGNGSAVSRFIIEALPDGAVYTGVDIHQPSIDYANAHFGRENATFQRDLPPEGSQDIIVYADVLEHLDDPDAFLQQHRTLLKPGGLVVGSIPNGIGPFEIESALDRRFRLSQRIANLRKRAAGETPQAIPYNSDSGHLQFYRKRPFIGMIERAGFGMQDFRNGVFFGAMVTERVLRYGGQTFHRLNTGIAQYLPHWAVSTWLFTFARD